MVAKASKSHGLICLLDDNFVTLEAKTRLFSSAGWEVQPFAHSDPFLRYARVHRPKAAVVDFGLSRSAGRDIADRLRAVSPETQLFIVLKIHGREARGVLSGNELINGVNQQCIDNTTGTQTRLSPPITEPEGRR